MDCSCHCVCLSLPVYLWRMWAPWGCQLKWQLRLQVACSPPCFLSEQEARALTPLRTLPQAALDERGTAAAQQISAELSRQIRVQSSAPYAAAVREMGEEQDGKVARRVGAAAHLLALLLHSLAEQDDNDLLGDPAVLSGAPLRPQETGASWGTCRILTQLHSCCQSCQDAARQAALLQQHRAGPR